MFTSVKIPHPVHCVMLSFQDFSLPSYSPFNLNYTLEDIHLPSHRRHGQNINRFMLLNIVIISPQMLGARRLQRCHSETEAMIKSAISQMYSDPDLLGDCSKVNIPIQVAELFVSCILS